MPGRYGATAKASRDSAPARSRASLRFRLLGLVAGTALVGSGVLALTSMADQPEETYQLGAADPGGEAVVRDGDELSRSASRQPGRLAHLLPKEQTQTPTGQPERPQRPAETEEPDELASPEVTIEANEPPDPNKKPEATAPLPRNSGKGERIVFDITEQQVWLVDGDGDVARTYLVSGSRHDQLDAGTYEVFSKSADAVSWTLDGTMRYMVRFHKGENSNIGFHDIPVYDDSGKKAQTLSQLGTALSDGCIRQDPKDAKALWDFAPVGTTVVVVRT